MAARVMRRSVPQSGTSVPLTGGTMTGELVAPDFKATGKTGATATPAFLAGGTASGAPTTGAHVKGELVSDDTGRLWFCTVAGTPGTWVQVNSPTFATLATVQVGNLLTSGEETINRMMATSSTVGLLASQRMWLTYFTARKAEVVANIKAITGNTLAAATPTLCRMGLYTVAANGDIALVAACANDTTLFAATNTVYSRALASPATYQMVAGQRYAFALLVVSAAAIPTFYGVNPLGANVASEAAIAPKLSGFVNSQADLPASVVSASITAGGQMFYGVVLP